MIITAVFQIRQRGLHHGAPCCFFFNLPVSRACQSQAANERREREPLGNESDEDHAKSEKDGGKVCSGKEAPLSGTFGREMAAASATTPRMPVQPTMKTAFEDGKGSGW